ncbi:MAG: hypothetical protein Tsb0013_24080 [Phycisphaerales bacterium]
MLKKLLNFVLLSNGITPADEDEPADKWARFRAEREAWEHEQNLKRAAPSEPSSPGAGDADQKPE